MRNNFSFFKQTIAHRGVHNDKIPENSMESFKEAMHLSLPIELDVQLTKDNQLVIFHDNRLNHMTKSNQLIQDMNYKDIQNLNLLNTKEKIPTLFQVLTLVQGKVPLIIEIKNTNRINEIGVLLSNLLDSYPYDFILQSFNPAIVKWFRKNKPEYIIGLLITDDYHNTIYNYLASSKLLIYYTQPCFLSVSKKIVKKNKFQRYRKKFPLLIWTIMNKKELETLKEYGDYFICNHLPY